MNDKKSLFNFYLDDNVKEECVNKLERVCGKKEKGQLSALIRVLLNQFIYTPDNQVDTLLIEAIDAEYEYSQKKNKRSRL